MADMENFYDDFIIINLFYLEFSSVFKVFLEFKPENDLNSWPLNGDSLSQEIKSLTLGLMLRRRQDGALFFTCTRLATV